MVDTNRETSLVAAWLNVGMRTLAIEDVLMAQRNGNPRQRVIIDELARADAENGFHRVLFANATREFEALADQLGTTPEVILRRPGERFAQFTRKYLELGRMCQVWTKDREKTE